MSERTSYEPGTPCWIDLGTPDQDAAAEFYGALFGWSVEADENAEETGGYRVATLRDKAIGGVMKLMEEGQPPSWSTYIAVEDADATAAKAKEAGGSVMFEPMDVLDYGRMAFIVDPTGAVLGLWQPGKNIGAGLVNEPGALSWDELNTRDVDAAKSFYGSVFGWTFDEQGTYTMILLGGNPVGGILNMAEQEVPAEVPAHWQVYFAVEDTDATVETAKGVGGNVMLEPFDTPVGRIAILTDPWGASFAVIALSEEARENAP
ncbi:MAG TPA: VOC family protein [Solirubrobacterales bacterium]|nr:VOC family protein [Solirubrobacterales bacterium]